jgi:selenide,water dikinase
MSHPDLLVGIGGSDDAGVFRLSDSVALVQTVDFFTPIVDDARDWGRITAANALSDVYAMGGRPLTALQIVGWPRDKLPFDLLGDVLEGAAEIMAEAGVTILGGHSIDDPEPKFGFAITGLVDPDDMTTNTGALAGDALVLTKPIGTGLIATGIKRGVVADEVRDAAVEVMAKLNDRAGSAATTYRAHAVTDVTGFGLIGHLGEMLDDVGVVLDTSQIPIIEGASDLAREGVVPGGTKRNRTDAARFVSLDEVNEELALLLVDAQTSGGLLVALDPDVVDAFIEEVDGAVWIGTFVDDHPGRVVLQ